MEPDYTKQALTRGQKAQSRGEREIGSRKNSSFEKRKECSFLKLQKKKGRLFSIFEMGKRNMKGCPSISRRERKIESLDFSRG